MSRKQLYIIRSVILLCLLLAACQKQEKHFLEKDLPLFDGAYNIKKVSDKPPGINLVSYMVNISFPASELISFYDQAFQREGLLPYMDDGYGSRKWEVFNPKTGNWESNETMPGRYIATWVDRERKIRIVLSLRYQYDGKDINWNRKIIANCSIQKIFDFRELGKIVPKENQ